MNNPVSNGPGMPLFGGQSNAGVNMQGKAGFNQNQFESQSMNQGNSYRNDNEYQDFLAWKNQSTNTQNGYTQMNGNVLDMFAGSANNVSVVPNNQNTNSAMTNNYGANSAVQQKAVSNEQNVISNDNGVATNDADSAFEELWNSIINGDQSNGQQVNGTQSYNNNSTQGQQASFEDQAQMFDNEVVNYASSIGLTNDDIANFSQTITPQDIAMLIKSKKEQMMMGNGNGVADYPNAQSYNNQQQHNQYEQKKFVPPASLVNYANGVKPGSMTSQPTNNSVDSFRY